MAINDTVLQMLEREDLSNKSILTLGKQDWLCKKPENLNLYSLDLFTECPEFSWDLNFIVKNIPTFDIIFDGGTLEHVFNIPNAFKNIHLLLNKGGVFCRYGLLNLTGHGFYDLSPELFFRWFYDNGFHDCRCFIKSKIPFFKKWREVKWCNKRIEFTSILPLEMWFRATKDKNLFIENFTDPIQSGPSITPQWKFLLHEARLYRHKKLTT